ncbi:MAG: TIR domain-containing protein [Desulfotomaculales bacterium]
MARRVFFSFHYERDAWRAAQVRNSWVTKPDREAAGFWDAAAWEEVKKKGEEAIKRWIDRQLEGTSVTAVLIGAETSERKYVQYEIRRSYERGNGLLGVYIHNLKDKDGKTDSKGKNPFDYFYIDHNSRKVYFSAIYPTYDWVDDNGYESFGDWVEKAAKKAGK